MTQKGQKIRNIGAWILQVLLGLQMLMAGQAKFTRSDSWASQFEGWGYPDNFFYLIGGLEVIFALAIFIPKLTSYASLVLTIIMIGAVLTHATHGENFVAPLVVAMLQLFLAWLRKPYRMALKRS